MSRKVCVVTGTRAEYGLLRWLMEELRSTPGVELQVVVTGMHLSPEFGLTFREVEESGFEIAAKVEMLLSSDTPAGVASSMGLGLIGFGATLQRLRPDVVVVLGDRFEVFSAATAAMVARIPVAHLHGGEATEGSIDEPIRHSITKMSQLHFVAAEEYRRRVIQLGEQPDRVFLVGSLAVDAIRRLQFVDRPELETALDFKLGARNLLVTFHPATLENATATEQMTELLAALERVDAHLILTMPNADTDGRALIGMIERFVAGRPTARAFTSLGQRLYLSCMRQVDGVVGNSSSGLIEAPSFRKGTVNIGDRQRGRLRATSVLDCPPDRESISAAIATLYSASFQDSLADVHNPYDRGGASTRIAEVLASTPLGALIKKRFYNLSLS